MHSVSSEISTASKPEMLLTCGAQDIHVVLLSCFPSSPGITDRERSAGSALTSCTVTVHWLPPVPSQCIRLCSSSQRSFFYWVPVLFAALCSAGYQGMHRMKWDQGVKWDPCKEFDLSWFGIR